MDLSIGSSTDASDQASPELLPCHALPQLDSPTGNPALMLPLCVLGPKPADQDLLAAENDPSLPPNNQASSRTMRTSAQAVLNSPDEENVAPFKPTIEEEEDPIHVLQPSYAFNFEVTPPANGSDGPVPLVSPEPPHLNFPQVWSQTQFFLFASSKKIIDLSRGLINDSSSVEGLFFFVPPSNSLVSFSNFEGLLQLTWCPSWTLNLAPCTASGNVQGQACHARHRCHRTQ